MSCLNMLDFPRLVLRKYLFQLWITFCVIMIVLVIDKLSKVPYGLYPHVRLSSISSKSETTSSTADYFNLSMKTASRFVFVHASSSEHFMESKAAVQSIQRDFPNKQLLFYDIGLKIYQRLEVQTWCRVTYRHFDFSLYPAHVRQLLTYAFKPIIVESVIRERGAVLWVDASIRTNHVDLQETYRMAVRNTGAVLFIPTNHSIHAATHPALIHTLGMSNYSLTVEMYGSGLFLLYGTKQVFQNIIRPWKECAMNQQCIAPAGSKLECDFKNNRFIYYGNCHRYDQSVLNLLILKYMCSPVKYDKSRLINSGRMMVHRHQERFAHPKICFNKRTYLEDIKVMIANI